MHIKVKRGLDIPIKGKPGGPVQHLNPPKFVALDLDRFDEIKFKLLVRVGDSVKVGQPLAFDKEHPERMFVSPAGGKVHEIRRGLKRRLLAVVIERAQDEEFHPAPPNSDDLKSYLLAAGMFAHIFMRPFGRLANPTQKPRAIFVKALESAPFVPSAELQIGDKEDYFQRGLQALTQLTEGPVHLVTRGDSPITVGEGITHHTASGPHPVANPSVHIERISPITGPEDVVWTLDAYAVLLIGTLLSTGKLHTEKVIGIGGEGILPDRRGYFRVRAGHPLEELMADRTVKGKLRLISGNPLTGQKREAEGFLGFGHFAFTVLPEPKKREFLHFMRPGFGKYTHSRAYPAGQFPSKKLYSFTTSSHGEERAFIDGRVYDSVMPLRVPTMSLVKAIIGRNWEEAQFLGLLEIDPEDFALPTFICPSKVEMCEIVREGLREYAAEVL